MLSSVVRQLTSDLPDGFRVLEVGCGTGNVLRVLEKVCSRGRVFGMELFEEGLKYARQRVSCPLVAGNAHRSPFRVKFHVIGLFDVLEHLSDDLPILRDLYAQLEDGGVLLLTVPAHPSLWSYADVAACHHRRYTRPQLGRILREVGFEVEFLTEFMMTIFPLVWLKRRAAAITKPEGLHDAQAAIALGKEELRIVPGLNALLTGLLHLEARLVSRRARLPFGTSLLAIARKRA
ncbi:MAG: class I SAM-dependent methyltransferase [bacterium]